MKGMSWASLKQHYSLIPLFVLCGTGITGAIGYLIRIAIKDPEANWTRSNPEPWNEYKNKQYKFYSPTLDYSKIKSQAPEY